MSFFLCTGNVIYVSILLFIDCKLLTYHPGVIYLTPVRGKLVVFIINCMYNRIRMSYLLSSKFLTHIKSPSVSIIYYWRCKLKKENLCLRYGNLKTYVKDTFFRGVYRNVFVKKVNQIK